MAHAEPERADPPSPFTVALAALALVVLFTMLPRWLRRQHELVGKPAPDFSLEVVHNGTPGAQMRLSQLSGKPVLVDFWATWCGPCQLEAPILSRVAERYRDRGLVVLGVNTSDRPGLAATFAQKKGLTYPVLFDGQNVAGELYGVESLPTMVLVGKDGAVRAVRTGLVDESAIDAMVGEAL